MTGIFNAQFILWTALVAVFRGCKAQSNSSLDPSSCWVTSDRIVFLGWAREDEGLRFSTPPYDHVQVTATVITTVHTALNSTEVNTSLPPDWTPPPTNAAGTRIHAFKWAGTDMTLTFPTVSIEWPRGYAYCTDEADATTECYDNGNIMTSALITSQPPQPTKPLDLKAFNYVDPEQLSDAKGILANPVVIHGSAAWQPPCSKMLGAYYPAFNCQSYAWGGPVWGGLDQTWMAVETSTVYAS